MELLKACGNKVPKVVIAALQTLLQIVRYMPSPLCPPPLGVLVLVLLLRFQVNSLAPTGAARGWWGLQLVRRSGGACQAHPVQVAAGV
jgi:hypothetical protein